MDYDASSIPVGYDRAREHGPAVLRLWMDDVRRAVRGRGRIRAILDLGCGTGRFSGGLAETFDADVIGIDPSIRMLSQARPKHGSRLRGAVGRGEDLPVPDGRIDLIFLSMVFHHFSSPERVAEECRRVLRDEGVVYLRAGTVDRVPTYPCGPFFPSSVPLMQETLPTCARVREVFEGAGFGTLSEGLVVQQIAATHGEYADKLAAGGDSVLARLDGHDLDAGLSRLREHAARNDPEPVTEAIDCFVFG
jgi:ubiquinone/menaquinone biosynthesis C-methylase UbiE